MRCKHRSDPAIKLPQIHEGPCPCSCQVTPTRTSPRPSSWAAGESPGYKPAPASESDCGFVHLHPVLRSVLLPVAIPVGVRRGPSSWLSSSASHWEHRPKSCLVRNEEKPRQRLLKVVLPDRRNLEEGREKLFPWLMQASFSPSRVQLHHAACRICVNRCIAVPFQQTGKRQSASSVIRVQKYGPRRLGGPSTKR